MLRAVTTINDFRHIRVNDNSTLRCLRPEDTLVWHVEAKNYIAQQLEVFKTNTVVVSHHGAFRACKSFNETDRLLALDSAFVSDLSKDIVHWPHQPLVWINGHTHHHLDQMLETGVRLFSNPRGYHDELKSRCVCI